MQFEIGDTVQRRRGGSVMTVERVQNDEVDCVWFDDDDQLRRFCFRPKALRMVMLLLALLCMTGCTKAQVLEVASATVETSVEANNALVAALQKIHDRTKLDRESAMIAVAQTAESKEAGKAQIDKIDADYAVVFETFDKTGKVQAALAELLEAARAAIDAGESPDVDGLLALGAELQGLHSAILTILAELR